ncbi:hypothetical protein ACERK3_05665 [Phycisphaerales bacterium AB-hyl4]|uniref:Uncharacterized protein n=1 Tax=Natronomicrosphaera hydrolytica TaxID=3242702 RepID=A0ABV4U4P3_9BACT
MEHFQYDHVNAFFTGDLAGHFTDLIERFLINAGVFTFAILAEWILSRLCGLLKVAIFLLTVASLLVPVLVLAELTVTGLLVLTFAELTLAGFPIVSVFLVLVSFENSHQIDRADTQLTTGAFTVLAELLLLLVLFTSLLLVLFGLLLLLAKLCGGAHREASNSKACGRCLQKSWSHGASSLLSLVEEGHKML